MRLRGKVKVGAPLSPEDAAWLEQYEQARDSAKQATSAGASRRRVVEHREEESVAVGVGGAAEVAAAAALSREEGRRYDHLLDGVVRGFTSQATIWQQITAALLADKIEDRKVIRDLLRAHHDNRVTIAEMEADAIRRDAEHSDDKDPISKVANDVVTGLIMSKMGVTPPHTPQK